MAETSTRQAAGTQAITVGMARRPGTEPPCADGYDLQRRGQRVCAAVVDGAGHDAAVVRYAQAVPPVITHIGMTMGGLAALTTAGQMAHAYDTPPHASGAAPRKRLMTHRPPAKQSYRPGIIPGPGAGGGTSGRTG
ncbi:hypothetical protein AB0H23_32550 [Streptomyces albogriseolus]|uniref:hypothetical protein n=1 Tax=Streptomyces albogriseolus TaxID=1887 RepID=UPI0034606486